MIPHPLVAQSRFARNEFVRGLDGVSEVDGVVRRLPMNSLGWMVGHLANQEHRYWVMLAQGMELVPVSSTGSGRAGRRAPRLSPRCGRCGGQSPPRPTTTSTRSRWTAWAPFLLRDGQPIDESVGTMLMRMIYHYWFHAGEAAAVRQLLGHQGLPEFVGDMDAATYRPEADHG